MPATISTLWGSSYPAEQHRAYSVGKPSWTESTQLQGTYVKLTFIYVPAEDAPLQIMTLFTMTFLIIAGDLNIQISKARQAFDHVIGPHGLVTETNDKGMRLLTFVLHKDSWPGTHTILTSGSTKLSEKPRVPKRCATRSTMSPSLSVGTCPSSMDKSMMCEVIAVPMLLLTPARRNLLTLIKMLASPWLAASTV